MGRRLLIEARNTRPYHHRDLLSTVPLSPKNSGRATTPAPTATAMSLPFTNGSLFSTSISYFEADQKDIEEYPSQHDPDSETNRNQINTDRHEYSKSGSDNAVAAMSSAWDVRNVTPDQVREASDREARDGGDGRVSPLEISPANREVSRFTDEDGRGESVVHGPSRRVSPRKGKRVDYGGAAIEGPRERGDVSKT